MFEISPIEQTALGTHVAHQLRHAVVTGQLPAGQRLVEHVLAEQFGVSRGPIRDALRELAQEGLLESRRRGFFVVGLREDDIKELYELRESLESLALRRTAARATAADWESLERALSGMRDAADRHDAAEFAVADLAFHSQFYELSGHRRLLSVWEHYLPTFTTLLQVTTAEDVDLHPSLQSHAEILSLLRAGDIPAALTELSEHLLGASNRLRTAHQRIRQQGARQQGPGQQNPEQQGPEQQGAR
jgi:GntR family transcriptional regulator, gluconate operon transcriptional repressor